MRRYVKSLLGVSISLIAVLAALAIAIVIWAFGLLPHNMDPPDSLLPQVILQVFWVELGGSIDSQPELPSTLRLPGQLPESIQDRAPETLAQVTAMFAMRRQPRGLRQLQYTFASILASAIISKNWTARAALTEIASRSYYGHGFTGITEAAAGFFGLSVTELSTKQVAMLATITRSPARYSPWCSPEELEDRMTHLRTAFGFSAGLPDLLPAPSDACEKAE